MQGNGIPGSEAGESLVIKLVTENFSHFHTFQQRSPQQSEKVRAEVLEEETGLETLGVSHRAPW